MKSKETENGYQMTVKSDTLRNFQCSTNHMFSKVKLMILRVVESILAEKAIQKQCISNSIMGSRSETSKVDKLTNHQIDKSRN